LRIGVLALQGAFIEHIHKLRQLGIQASEVRLPQEMPGLDGLIIPGGPAIVSHSNRLQGRRSRHRSIWLGLSGRSQTVV